MSPNNPKSLISHTVSGSSESQFYDVNHAREPRAVIVFPLSFLSFVPAHRARGGLGGGWQVGQGCPTAHHPPAPHHPLPHLHHQPPELGSGPIQPPSCCWVLPAPVPATLLCPGAGDPRQGRGRGWPQWGFRAPRPPAFAAWPCIVWRCLAAAVARLPAPSPAAGGTASPYGPACPCENAAWLGQL